ncbi:DUF484 family protein [Orbaceae bacterium ESL0727]|nr:DUF484 family protein [Orbaceae bacterium ESL0727]
MVSDKTKGADITAKTDTASTKAAMSNLIDEDVLCHYLREHPDFFIRHANEIGEIAVPHPIRGEISLPEWQMARQRHKIKQLELEITQLMENASANEQLVNQLMLLQNQLMVASDLDELSDRLNNWAKSMGLTGAYLYLFDDKWQLGAPLNYYHFSLNSNRFDFIRVRHLQYSHQYLGTLNSAELDFLLPQPVLSEQSLQQPMIQQRTIQQRSHIGSVALSLFGEFGDLGLVMFASPNPHHYQAGQGTWLIEKISDMLPILINQWISQKKRH